MLRYAADLNGKIAGLSVEDFREKTRFFVFLLIPKSRRQWMN
jgi:hypothetical protein